MPEQKKGGQTGSKPTKAGTSGSKLQKSGPSAYKPSGGMDGKNPISKR